MRSPVRGLVDHILHHLRYDADKETWRIEPPEYGEFPEVLERHGFWRPDEGFKEFAEVVSEQLSLLPENEEEGPEPSEEDGAQATLTSVTYKGQAVDMDTGEVLEEAGARSE